MTVDLIFKLPYSGGVSGAQRPKRAPRQEPKVKSRISGESEPPVRRANESLSVPPPPDQQQRAFREAVCEERAGAAAGAGASRQAGVSSYQQETPKNSEVM